MADEFMETADDQAQMVQIGKVVVAGVVFGMVIKNAIGNGLLEEVKGFKISNLISASITIVPKIVNALKGNQAVAMLEDAGREIEQADHAQA